MDAQARPELPLSEEDGADRRRSLRRPASKLVVVKSSAGEREKALIRDVSLHGCCLVSTAKWLRPGTFITIALSTERSIRAVVRWARNNMYGAEFLRPIPPEEAEELADD